MKVILLLLGTALLVKANDDSSEHGVKSTGVSPNCTCGWANKGDQRIVNGRSTKTYEYPMLAGLVSKHQMKMFCGGTIITKKHVLTAAHCTMNVRPSYIGIHVGSNSYDKVKWNHNLHPVESFTSHPKWSRPTVVYDISIVTITDEFAFSRNIGPACLPTGKVNLPGQKVKVLGWGKLYEGGPGSPDLLQVDLDVRTHEYCHERNPNIEKTDRHQFCTYTESKDSCQGDSGGPLLWLNPKINRYTLVGATSYGTGCARYPAVNTEVSYFLPWIQDVIAKTSNGLKTCGI